MKEVVLAILFLICIFLPIIGFIGYLWLIRKMRKEQVPDIPRVALFALFFIYGGVLIEVLMGLFGEWSGMASLGLLFLVFVAPVVCGMIVCRHRRNIGVSKYHRILFRMAFWYLQGEAVLVGSLVLVALYFAFVG